MNRRGFLAAVLAAAAAPAYVRASSLMPIVVPSQHIWVPPFHGLAWVRFNGVNGGTVLSAKNVVDVAQNGLGDYTLTFENTLKDHAIILAPGPGILTLRASFKE